ncbi:MAG TPA: hypothetical protein VIJ15_12415, partial [Dermatophilaceae bacterium]
PEQLTVPPGGLPVPAPAPRTSRAALVTEALGYLGGVIILVALGLVVGTVWDELSAGVRIALVGVVTVLLLIAGALIPARLGATGVRLRSVLWLASSAALAAFLALGASEWAGWADETQAMCAALGTALYSAALWWAHRHLLQQVAVFVPLLVGVGTGVSLLPDAGALPGLAVWGVSAAWLALAWGGLLPGRQIGMVLGAVGMVTGVITAGNEGWSVLLVSTTLSALIALALTIRDLVILGVGALGTLMVLPELMNEYFPGALAPALVLLGLGVLLVVAAVLTTRRRGDAAPGEEPRWATGTRRSGLLVAAVFVVATSAVVLVAGVS